jgi:hypothetical protein
MPTPLGEEVIHGGKADVELVYLEAGLHAGYINGMNGRVCSYGMGIWPDTFLRLCLASVSKLHDGGVSVQLKTLL